MTPDDGRVTQIMREVAAEEIMPRFRRLGRDDIAEKRSPNDLVTTADIEAEKRLSAALRALMPGSAVVGEEGVERDPHALAALAGDRPVWVIDPVDGTLNYARGRACFAVIIALCRHEETVAGWILDPVADVAVSAVAGQGAWLDEGPGAARRRLVLSPAKPVERMAGSLGKRLTKRVEARAGLRPDRARKDAGGEGAGGEGAGGAAKGTPPLARPCKMVKYGCTGREYMDLATGELDFAQYTRLKPWDHAAGILIHGEAGGLSRMTATGTPYRPAPRILEETVLLAPDAASWDALHAVFRDAAHEGPARDRRAPSGALA